MMVSPLNTPPPSPPPPGDGEPVIEAGAAAPQTEMKTTVIKLVAVRKVTDMPMTNRGDVKGKVSEALELLSSEVCTAIASADCKNPREEVESRLEPDARETATGFDAHVLGMIDTLLTTVDLDVAASVTAEEPEGRPYDPDGHDNDMPVSGAAKAFWLNKMSAMRLYATDKPELNHAVELAIRFTAQPDSEPSAGERFTSKVLEKLAQELELPVSDLFVQGIYVAFKFEDIAGDFEGLNIAERIFLKCVVNNRFEFNQKGRELAHAFADRYPDSRIAPLLAQGEVSVNTRAEGEMPEDGADAGDGHEAGEEAAVGVSRLKF